MLKLAIRLNATVNDWLTAPEFNAAGRLGLFRTLFSIFYLWHLSTNFTEMPSGLPAAHRHRILLIELFPQHLPPVFFEMLESLLVMALVLLMVGFRSRLATAIVLVSGSILEAFYISIDVGHATVFLVFYIPFFMLLNDCWGHTYSLDALLQQRAGGPRVEPSNSSWSYFLPARAVLVVLSMLFFSAAVFKVTAGSRWLERPDWVANLLLEKNIRAAIHELPLNPLAPIIAENPIVYKAFCYQVVLFEVMFFLALFNRKLRNLLLALALVFHSVSMLWLFVTFTPILIVYALFIDWQGLREWLWPKRVTLLDSVPSPLLIWAALSLAVAAGALWNFGGGLRMAFNLGGLLDWRTIWYPIFLLSSAWCLVALVDLSRSILIRVRAVTVSSLQ